MKIMPILVAATTILVNSGCGTFMGRGQQNVADIEQGIYPATRTDGTIFWLCITGNSVFQTHSSGWVAPIAGYTIVPFCFLIDLPISLVTDTVMLPADIRKPKERHPTDIPDNIFTAGCGMISPPLQTGADRRTVAQVDSEADVLFEKGDIGGAQHLLQSVRTMRPPANSEQEMLKAVIEAWLDGDLSRCQRCAGELVSAYPTGTFPMKAKKWLRRAQSSTER